MLYKEIHRLLKMLHVCFILNGTFSFIMNYSRFKNIIGFPSFKIRYDQYHLNTWNKLHQNRLRQVQISFININAPTKISTFPVWLSFKGIIFSNYSRFKWYFIKTYFCKCNQGVERHAYFLEEIFQFHQWVCIPRFLNHSSRLPLKWQN
jgi:hypothetical protein